ncbi:MAG: DoxX family membrane protein, partial [Pseudomonadota bacterium]
MESAADTEQMQTKAWLFRPETARGFARFYSRSTLIFWPITDLVTRAFIALPYFRSGLIKAGDWDKAVMLATYEYPVSWLSPEAAAATGLAIELIAPVLLLLGLLTRPAALALLILT